MRQQVAKVLRKGYVEQDGSRTAAGRERYMQEAVLAQAEATRRRWSGGGGGMVVCGASLLLAQGAEVNGEGDKWWKPRIRWGK
eukprot:jgi/Ulvmu1/2450/UM136_0002.1